MFPRFIVNHYCCHPRTPPTAVIQEVFRMTKMHNRRKLPCGHFTYVLAGESGEPPLGNLVREVKFFASMHPHCSAAETCMLQEMVIP